MTLLIYSSVTKTSFLPTQENPFKLDDIETHSDNEVLFTSFKHIEERREKKRLAQEKVEQEALKKRLLIAKKAKEKALEKKRVEEKKELAKLEAKRLLIKKLQKEKEAQEKLETARMLSAKKERELVAKRILELKAIAQKKALEKEKKQQAIFAKSPTHNSITAHVDLSEQKINVYKGTTLLHQWRVSTARRGYVTPTGTYKPLSMQKMHYSKKYHNSPMPYSIFFKGGYALHGTRSISRLGHIASHGCVRLHPTHAKELYALIKEYGKENTTITITQ